MISERTLKDALVRAITERQGLKATELVTAVEHFLSDSEWKEFLSLREIPIIRLMDEMVEAGEVMEVEYCLASMPYRSKSFYLPRETEISITA